MRQQLTAFDIYDIFYFPKDGDLCQFYKLNLTKEEFLRGEFLGGNAMSLKKCLIYFYMPSNNELTMGELATLLEKLGLSHQKSRFGAVHQTVKYHITRCF